jgi:hypothetical protein
VLSVVFVFEFRVHVFGAPQPAGALLHRPPASAAADRSTATK